MRESTLTQSAHDVGLVHPAVRAWRRLHPTEDEPEEIQTLKRKNKSAIYRLRAFAPDGASLIAKRSLRRTAITERAIYQKILPHLAVPSLQYYGFAEDPDLKYCWNFIEDAGEQACRLAVPRHRELLVHWLALLHTAGTRFGATVLPRRDPGHYLKHLRLARARIRRHASNPVLAKNELALLEEIVSRCDLLESNWPHIEQFCAGMPETVVHGDLKEKNMRIAESASGLRLLIFDWEAAGCGIPGPDLASCPDLAAYHAMVRKCWPWVKQQDVERMAQIGKLFRALAAIDWESWRLEFDNLERPILNIRDFFLVQLTDIIQALELR